MRFASVQKLQELLADAIQKKPHTPSEQVRIYHYSRSQDPQRKRRIAEHSEVCNCGTRFSHPMDSKLPMQNKNFTRDGEKSTEVSQSQKVKDTDNSLEFGTRLCRFVNGTIVCLHTVSV